MGSAFSSVYSRWDGTQEEFRVDADAALDALSELMMHGLDAEQALEWMRRHGFELAGLDMRVMGLEELLAELRDRLRELREQLQALTERGRGEGEAADELRQQIQALEQAIDDLASGELEAVSAEDLAEWLGEQAGRSLIWLRGLESSLQEAGYLRGSDPELTPRAIRRMGSQALAEVYASLRRDRPGGHEQDARGAALPRPDETKPFEFGDPLDLDVVQTVIGAARRHARSAPGRPLPLPLPLEVEDFALRERDFTTHATTVLLLDMSWSMSWAGRFPAAKRLALAMDHLIRTRFPRDYFGVVGFSTRARELSPAELPEVSWDMGDPFTNLQGGLMIAEQLIAKHPSASPQVLVVTDGQPTAYYRGRELHVEWPSGMGGVAPHAVAETLKQVKRITRRGATINTFMLDDAPELVGFVERMTQTNRGRAFFTRPEALGSFVMVDYLRGRKCRAR